MSSKLIIFVAVFSVLAVVNEAGRGMPLGEDVTKAFRAISNSLSKLKVKANMMVKQHRMRRQSSQCYTDIEESEQPRFMNCERVLEMLGGESNISLSNVTAYCRGNCSGYILSLYGRLERDCGLPDELSPSDKALLRQSCDQGPNRYPCLYLWSTLAHLSNTSTEFTTYSNCLQEYKRNSKVCNTDCKLAEQWIESNAGCCYKTLVDYYRSMGITEGILTDDNWDLCNEKEPDSCT